MDISPKTTKSFPDEILATIIDHLAPDPAQMSALKSVDSQFRRIVRDDTYWRLFSPASLSKGLSLHDAFEARKDLRTRAGNRAIYDTYARERVFFVDNQVLLETTGSHDDDLDAARVYIDAKHFAASHGLRDDRHIAESVVRRDGSLYRFLSSRLARQRPLALLAAKQSHLALKEMSKIFLHDDRFMYEAILAHPEAADFAQKTFFSVDFDRVLALFYTHAQTPTLNLHPLYKHLPSQVQSSYDVALLYYSKKIRDEYNRNYESPAAVALFRLPLSRDLAFVKEILEATPQVFDQISHDYYPPGSSESVDLLSHALKSLKGTSSLYHNSFACEELGRKSIWNRAPFETRKKVDARTGEILQEVVFETMAPETTTKSFIRRFW